MKIFVVDDCVDSADLVVEILTTLGHQVGAAYGGADGVQILSRNSVDVILLDLRMPGMDGFQVLNELRSNSANSRTRIVAFTGCADAATISKMEESGFDCILVKPVSVEAITEALGIEAVVS